MTRRILVALILLATACSNGSSSIKTVGVGDYCEDGKAECAPSTLCINNVCREVCNSNTDCIAMQRCIAGTCLPVSSSDIYCGDGVIDPGESCDDGNRVDTDGCTNGCDLARCGDGIARTDITDPTATGYEACDDGDFDDTDGCLTSCLVPSCPDADGDGYVAGGANCAFAGPADCDDGVATCTTDCTTDVDGDGQRDCDDTCLDADHDGFGRPGADRSGCLYSSVDSDDGNAAACIDTDGDGCDDCALGSFDPAHDGTDADGDGLCAAGDCDDGIPTCTTDCATNTDEAGEPIDGRIADCVETYCLSDPTDPASSCVLANTEAELTSVVTGLGGGVVHALLGDITVTTDPNYIVNGSLPATVRQRRGAALTISPPAGTIVDPFLDLRGADLTIRDLSIVGDGLSLYTGIRDEGDRNAILDSQIVGFVRAGISTTLSSNNLLVAGCTITGGTGASNNKYGCINLGASNAARVFNNTLLPVNVFGIASDNATAPTIVGNVIAGGGTSAIYFNSTDFGTIDHNTLAGNTGHGIAFGISMSHVMCVRDNDVSNNGGAAMYFNDIVDWNVDASATGTCVPPLPSDGGAGFLYGNNAFGNGAGACLTASGVCDCATNCMPPGALFSLAVDPHFASTSGEGAYCLDGASELVDAGYDLGYDRVTGDPNATTGVFVGTAPDVGAKESGAGSCL